MLNCLGNFLDLMFTESDIKRARGIVRLFFLDSNKQPFEMTDSQARIFLSIISPEIKWLWISAPTRFGKSNILAMALLYLASIKKLKIPVVAGSVEKANKIMEYVLQHISDNPVFYQGLINTELSDVEKLKVLRTKSALRWHHGGWIYILSVEANNTIKAGEGVVGEGGQVVVLEEAGLIRSEEQFSKIVRMPEEDKGWGKLIMSGNMIEQSVFEKAYHNPLYTKVRVTLEEAVAEGRFTWERLEEVS